MMRQGPPSSSLTQVRIQVCLNLHYVFLHDTCSSIGGLVSLPIDPNQVTHLSPESDRWMKERLLVCIDDGTIPDQVCFR